MHLHFDAVFVAALLAPPALVVITMNFPRIGWLAALAERLVSQRRPAPLSDVLREASQRTRSLITECDDASARTKL